MSLAPTTPSAAAAGSRVYRGSGVGDGLVAGPVLRAAPPVREPDRAASRLAPAAEHRRAHAALEAVAADLSGRASELDGPAREIVEAQALMAADPSLADDVDARIDEGRTAERAVFEAFEAFRGAFAAAGGYLSERAADLIDVARRVISLLRGEPAQQLPDSARPHVLVARDLSPADFARLDRRRVLAVVTETGGPTSHLAVLARERGVVAVVGVLGADELIDGEDVVVDAAAGAVVRGPSPALVARAGARRARTLRAADAVPGALADGRPVPLQANLGCADDVGRAIAAGAEGVGLVRTEYLAVTGAPTLEMQREEYARILDAFPYSTVTIRLFDAGSDKPLAFLAEGDEPNPALGARGIRALARHETELRRQLTALAEAARGRTAVLQVLAPMIATVAEARWFADLVHAAGIARAGAMIEVPAAAVMAGEIAEAVDFVSVGTNDLAQYVMAADRSSAALADHLDPWQPAVLRMIAGALEAAAAHGVDAGVCGEAAADPLLAVVLVGLGARSLSTAPAARAAVAAALAGVTAEVAERAAREAVAASDPSAARRAAALVVSPPDDDLERHGDGDAPAPGTAPRSAPHAPPTDARESGRRR